LVGYCALIISDSAGAREQTARLLREAATIAMIMIKAVFVQLEKRVYKATLPELIADEGFKNVVLYIATELVRHTRGYSFVTTDDIALALPVGKIEISCIIEVLVVSLVSHTFLTTKGSKNVETDDCTLTRNERTHIRD
jgi:hypothetical protein